MNRTIRDEGEPRRKPGTSGVIVRAMQYAIMGAIVAWIIFVEVASGVLNTFAARKLCHAGCGFGIMFLDPSSAHACYFVWLVAISSVAMTWDLLPLPPFRFSRPADVGITVYLSLVAGLLSF